MSPCAILKLAACVRLRPARGLRAACVRPCAILKLAAFGVSGLRAVTAILNPCLTKGPGKSRSKTGRAHKCVCERGLLPRGLPVAFGFDVWAFRDEQINVDIVVALRRALKQRLITACERARMVRLGSTVDPGPNHVQPTRANSGSHYNLDINSFADGRSRQHVMIVRL